MGFSNLSKLALSRLTITRQHALDPYGNLIARDDFPAFGQTSAPKTRLGHQGLTVDRLDAPWDVDLVVAGSSSGHPAGSTASPDATPRLIYLNRNRIYDPLFARFNQRDPNETGLPINGSALRSATSPEAPSPELDLGLTYADGMNLFAYVGSNPVNFTDPNGTMSLLEELNAASISAYLRASEFVAAHAAVFRVAGGLAAAFTTLREYVHGPEYVDQFMLQINQPGAKSPVVSYILQDDNYNVVALTNTSGVITRQHAFDPYGSLIARDDFPAFGQTAAPKTRLGHQGLMVDRLDAPWDVDLVVAGSSSGHPAGSTASPDATPRFIYLNRNRIYDPLFARFNQRDPNATALMLNATALVNGSSPAAQVQSLNIEAAFTDGANLFLYAGGDPVSNQDPMGLFFGGYLDLLGSVARGASRFYDAYAIAAKVGGLVGDVAAGNDIRASLLEMAIDASFDYGGGKAFEAAASGLSSLAIVFRTTDRLERSKAFRAAYEVTVGRIPRGWILHHAAPVEFEDFFRFKVKPPINIDDPRWGMPLHPDWHQWLHSSNGFNWNGKWREFIRRYTKGTTEGTVIRFLEKL